MLDPIDPMACDFARFLGEDKSAIQDFKKRTSGQATVDGCITSIRNTVIDRIQKFRNL